MSAETLELLIVSGSWAFAVFLYYFAGKKHGYGDGYIAGIEQGHKNVLNALSAGSDFLSEQTK